MTNGQVRRSGALYHSRTGTGGSANTGIIYNARRSYLAGAFTVEEIAGIDSIQQKTVAGVALTIGPDGLVAQTAIGPSAIRKFGVNAW